MNELIAWGKQNPVPAFVVNGVVGMVMAFMPDLMSSLVGLIYEPHPKGERPPMPQLEPDPKGQGR